MTYLRGYKMQQVDIAQNFSPSMENVLVILHELQKLNTQNYLTDKDLIWAADYLKVTYGQIYGIITYYTMFSLKPRGNHIIRVCRSPVCQMIGSDHILEHFKQILKTRLSETTSDGIFTLEPTECIGQCDKAPCLSVDDSVYGKVQPSSIDEIIKYYKERIKE
jgi:NADH:ubiquinone oxidoreductase subunit E